MTANARGRSVESAPPLGNGFRDWCAGGRRRIQYPTAGDHLNCRGRGRRPSRSTLRTGNLVLRSLPADPVRHLPVPFHPIVATATGRCPHEERTPPQLAGKVSPPARCANTVLPAYHRGNCMRSCRHEAADDSAGRPSLVHTSSLASSAVVKSTVRSSGRMAK